MNLSKSYKSKSIHLFDYKLQHQIPNWDGWVSSAGKKNPCQPILQLSEDPYNTEFISWHVDHPSSYWSGGHRSMSLDGISVLTSFAQSHHWDSDIFCLCFVIDTPGLPVQILARGRHMGGTRVRWGRIGAWFATKSGGVSNNQKWCKTICNSNYFVFYLLKY